MVLLGAAGQFGIYATLLLAVLLGFDIKQAASIGVIGAIDGPTAIFVASKLAPYMLGPIAVAAYSYMSLIPIIQPPIMKIMTTRKERLIRMDYAARPVSKVAVIAFPVVVTVAVSLVAPSAAPLIATLMLGNFLKECGVVDRLSKAAQNEIINIATLFLALAIGSTMTAANFINLQTLGDPGAGLAGFRDRYGGRFVVRQIDVLCHRRQDQPAHRGLRDQRLPDGRPAFRQDGFG